VNLLGSAPLPAGGSYVGGVRGRRSVVLSMAVSLVVALCVAGSVARHQQAQAKEDDSRSFAAVSQDMGDLLGQVAARGRHVSSLDQVRPCEDPSDTDGYTTFSFKTLKVDLPSDVELVAVGLAAHGWAIDKRTESHIQAHRMISGRRVTAVFDADRSVPASDRVQQVHAFASGRSDGCSIV
jgi:hypothetical protein